MMIECYVNLCHLKKKYATYKLHISKIIINFAA